MTTERKLTERVILFVAEGFGAGRIPFAPGTFGTVVGFAWLWILVSVPFFIPVDAAGFYMGGTIAGVLASVWIGGRAENILGLKDPDRIVIDEITAIPVAWLFFFFGSLHTDMMPEVSAWMKVLSVFVLFRLFDIWKPWPVKQSQYLPGGWGLTIDDVLASLYVNLAVICAGFAWSFRRGF